MIRVALCFLLVLAATGAALASTVVETVATPEGPQMVRTLTPAGGLSLEAVPANGALSPAGPRGAAEPLWIDRNHLNAVAENVAISGDGTYGIAGWWLNNMRTAVYRINDDNLPEWTRPMPLVQFTIPVDADDTADRMTSTGRGDSLYVFTSGTSHPVYHHGYTPPLVGYKDAVSDGGNTYVGAGGNPAGTGGEVNVYDGAGVLRFTAPLPAPPEGISVSADGLVVAANVRVFVKVWDAMTGALRDSIPISGETQTPAVLSGDGAYLVTGGFSKTVRLYLWDGADYVQSWSYNIPSTTWVTALAISEDGATIAAGTWTNPSGGRVVAFDRSGSTPLWTDSSFGDWVASVAVTPDGTRIAAGSWGRYAGTVGNLISVYDRASATPLAYIPDDAYPGVGSCFAVDISEDGVWVFAGGKAVHAREFGNGGWTMAVSTLSPGDVTDGGSRVAGSPRLLASPNPFRARTQIVLGAPAPAAGQALELMAVDGRRVRTLKADGAGASWLWDGLDQSGRPLPSGIYFARPSAAVTEGSRDLGEPLRLVKVR